MNLREQLNKPRWTVIGVAAAGLTAAVTGFALAGDDGNGGQLPGPISLDDRVPVSQTIEPPPSFDVVPGPILSADDSPFDDRNASASVSTGDSPDQVAPPAPAGDNSPDDSPDQVAPAPPAFDDSPDSSPDQVASPPPAGDNSPDSSPDVNGSFDSFDSPDSSG